MIKKTLRKVLFAGLTMIYIASVIFIAVKLQAPYERVLSGFPFFIFIAILFIASWILLNKIKDENLKSKIKIIVLINFVIMIFTFTVLFLSLFDMSVLRENFINYIAGIRLDEFYYMIFQLAVLSILAIIIVGKFKGYKKKHLITIMILAIIPVMTRGAITTITDVYFDSIESGMIVTENNHQQAEISFHEQQYKLTPRYEVEVVGDDGVYELNDIEEGLYYMDYYDTYELKVNITDNSPITQMANEIFDRPSAAIFKYDNDTKVEIKKYNEENSKIYLYDFSNFKITDYSDYTSFDVSQLNPTDMLITVNDDVMQIYVREDYEEGDYVWQYIYDKEDGHFKYYVFDEEIIGNVNKHYTNFNMNLLDKTYFVQQEN